jgi:Glycosyl hydrolases family 15
MQDQVEPTTDPANQRRKRFAPIGNSAVCFGTATLHGLKGPQQRLSDEQLPPMSKLTSSAGMEGVAAKQASDRAVRRSVRPDNLPVRDLQHAYGACLLALFPAVTALVSCAFVQTYGSAALDASALLFSLVGFLPPSDPRIKSTVGAIERDLMEDGLVLRYRPENSDDGLVGSEGAFLACTFWLVDNLVLLGRRGDALALFDHLLSMRNDLGLLAEEFDTRSRRMVGNFPQAFSHIALINSANNLSQHEKPAERRSGHAREPRRDPA